MKRSIEALVVKQTVVTIVALAMTTSVARAASPVVKLKSSASQTRSSTTGGDVAKLRVTAAFSTDTPGAQLFTIQKAVLFFPAHVGTNGRLFPSCSAARIERFHRNLSRCPDGSKIGSGKVKATALGITATARVTMFNSHHGKSITFNIKTVHPATIEVTIDAPLARLHGKYGEKLTLVLPHSLQEILPDVFVSIQDFDIIISGAVRVHGVEHDFLRARTCPKRALHGVFDFKNWTTGQTATTTADAKVRCASG
jgi:hypothetical protein